MENWLDISRPARRKDFQELFLNQLEFGAEWEETPNDFDTYYNHRYGGITYNRIVVAERDINVTPCYGSSSYVILAKPGVKVTGKMGHNTVMYFDKKYKRKIQKPTDIFLHRWEFVLTEVIKWSVRILIAIFFIWLMFKDC